MHLQTPPYDHDKLVYCLSGSAFDVVLDLRVGSPTFGCHESVVLDAQHGLAIYVPRGVAHGFCVHHGHALMGYLVTSSYAPGSDGGVRWDSAGIEWPIETPVLSARDAALEPLATYKSPFVYGREATR
jgi:dTDP-4-dehydrorhamnose 3,5-epimerase